MRLAASSYPNRCAKPWGLQPGSTVEISRYGAGLHLIPTGRTARLEEENGVLVATGETTIDDEVVFGLIDSGRK
ncbi:antitoxin VapB27 [Mycobacterium tuberculosis KT-0080]|nr:antitoxin VapB27 [Mycobacterium tuberculosis KT-0072]KCG77065.1 antitoxin VapB27 [Mycobacterium tuberculosis KT-0080]